MDSGPQFDRPASSGFWRLIGLGTELAASIAGGALLGWWLDRELGTAPRALAIATGIGAVGGLYNLIRQALAASGSGSAGTGRSGKKVR